MSDVTIHDSYSETLKALLRKSNRLNDLLTDSHPGLFTWNMALASVLNDIAQYAPDYVRIKEAEK